MSFFSEHFNKVTEEDLKKAIERIASADDDKYTVVDYEEKKQYLYDGFKIELDNHMDNVKKLFNDNDNNNTVDSIILGLGFDGEEITVNIYRNIDMDFIYQELKNCIIYLLCKKECEKMKTRIAI